MGRIIHEEKKLIEQLKAIGDKEAAEDILKLFKGEKRIIGELQKARHILVREIHLAKKAMSVVNKHGEGKVHPEIIAEIKDIYARYSKIDAHLEKLIRYLK